MRKKSFLLCLLLIVISVTQKDLLRLSQHHRAAEVWAEFYSSCSPGSDPSTDLCVSCSVSPPTLPSACLGPWRIYTLRNTRSVVATLRPSGFAKAKDQTSKHRWLRLFLLLFPGPTLLGRRRCSFSSMCVYWNNITRVKLDDEEESSAAVEVQWQKL